MSETPSTAARNRVHANAGANKSAPENTADAADVANEIRDERQLRAGTYSILAALLGAVPSRELLESLAKIKHDCGDSDDDIRRAWRQLQQFAAGKHAKNLTALEDEYHDLFIGLGRGQVVPFGSWHLSGFLMEQPLSDLRDDLRALGITKCARQKDPEDHIAALCESMALIIPAADINDARERRFFARHLLPWAGKFFSELQNATSANFYQPVGILGRRFIESECEYLNIRAHIQTH